MNKKIVAASLAALVLVTGLLVRYGAFAGSVATGVSPVTVNMPAAEALNITVSGQGQVALGEAALSEDGQDVVLGGSIHNIQESFDEGIAVDGTEVISGTGGFTISGNVTTTSLVTEKKTAFTSTASSQTLCAIQNTTGADRVLLSADLMYATSSATSGTFYPTVSQSGTISATGTGSNLYYENNLVAIPTNGISNVLTTSTLTSVRSVWKAGNFINFLVAVPTSTLTGSCRVTSS